jgi:mono/diheme cytochrome c family protein
MSDLVEQPTPPRFISAISTRRPLGGQTQTGNDGDVAAGKAVFSDNCAGCHGLTGHGGNGGPDLTAIPSAKTPTRVKSQVTNGGGGMPPFKGQLTPKQIKDVTAYVTKQITNKNK